MATISFLSDNPELDRDYDSQRLYPFSVNNSETGRRRPLRMIAAVGRNLELGRGGNLIWPLRGDLRHFKELTTGHPVIMGRATWESLPRRPLPGRLNVVVTHDASYDAPGAEPASGLREALDLCGGMETPFIIGGATLYEAALPYATRLDITEVDAVCDDADCHFPAFSPDEWAPAETGEWMSDAPEKPRYRFVTYLRKE